MMPHLVLIPFLFLLGACVGSFLNVVVWRLPRGESLITPPSHCPKCNTGLAWYDNIPVLGWIFLKGRCRYCREPISMRYPIIEAITGGLFVLYYVLFFILHHGLSCSVTELQRVQITFFNHWGIYLLYMWLISALLASSLIDAELFIIEPWVVWITAGVGILFHAIMDRNAMPGTLSDLKPPSAALAMGASLGWLVSGALWAAGKLPISFPHGEPILEAHREEVEAQIRDAKKRGEPVEPLPPPYTRNQIRGEMRKEMLFLMPPLLLGGLMVLLTLPGKPLAPLWATLYRYDWLRGLLGALLGGMVGGFTVWLTRILGTLGFGRVGMGRGDADLMFAVGAVLGAGPAVVAFFLAPFFGILIAIYILLFSKRREIPYGPYLSLAAAFVMVAYCPIAGYFGPGLQNLIEIIFSRGPQ
jgi:leader peptidase (prepilin peptidase)/N-methyltransferase